jgi:Tol biopolymer transport system component
MRRDLVQRAMAGDHEAGSNLRPINGLPAGDGDDDLLAPQWSPDSKQLLFHSADVWLSSLDGSDAHRISSGITDEWWPTFSPDGECIAFTTRMRSQTEFWDATT